MILFQYWPVADQLPASNAGRTTSIPAPAGSGRTKVSFLTPPPPLPATREPRLTTMGCSPSPGGTTATCTSITTTPAAGALAN
jgi:hypothetical protein